MVLSTAGRGGGDDSAWVPVFGGDVRGALCRSTRTENGRFVDRRVLSVTL
jgi:hypothetical protein